VWGGGTTSSSLSFLCGRRRYRLGEAVMSQWRRARRTAVTSLRTSKAKRKMRRGLGLKKSQTLIHRTGRIGGPTTTSLTGTFRQLNPFSRDEERREA
jgi:hypothetical protein